ncbi:hypothetical protein GQE99_15025 [Maritimibacter sp. DP07]|uniref:Uncharacterized protein n=1 Tax=Maritimibacter harenae TaxID=2606218 RepID=A0A845M1U9_9RHOB|nr:DUF6615 family protein [Maritimibacter harenae]MZR14330.1 hypothetical protein [Maritimibacter harenae]
MSLRRRLIQRYLRDLAGWVWAEQDDAFHYGLKLQEETITENLLLRMARETVGSPLKIKMFNKTKEGGSARHGIVGNGADWEWYFNTPYCQVGFRIQAKVLSYELTPLRKALSRGIYKGLKNDGEQAEDLIKAARADGCNPVYVFFNHPWVANRYLFSSTHSPFPGARKDWGCSVASATAVRDLADNRLSALFPHMMPWDRFFRLEPGCGVQNAFGALGSRQEFVPSTPTPEWLPILLHPEEASPSDDEPAIEGYLARKGLRGVAYFELSNE